MLLNLSADSAETLIAETPRTDNLIAETLKTYSLIAETLRTDTSVRTIDPEKDADARRRIKINFSRLFLKILPAEICYLQSRNLAAYP